MLKYYEIWKPYITRNIAEHGKTWCWTWQNMMEHGKIWRNLAEHDGIWRNMVEHGGTWRNIAIHDGTWRNIAEHSIMAEHRETWRNIADYIEHGETWGKMKKYGLIWDISWQSGHAGTQAEDFSYSLRSYWIK